MKTLPLLLAVLLLSISAGLSRAATTEEVEQAINKAKDWLYKQQANGHWDNEPPLSHQDGGMTAFVVYALLAMGESPQDDRLKKAIDWMLKNETNGTYAISLRCQVWNLMPQTAEVRAALKKDVSKLLFTTGPGRTQGVRGLYSYEANNQSNADPSSSQYGALGMWAATQAGFEIPNSYWDMVDKQWRKMQEPGGGWSYQGEPGDVGTARSSMTAAGIATLYITQDQLSAGKGAVCKGNISDPDVDRGMKWMADHFDKAISRSGYTLYGIERIGLASGRKYIGKYDWYQEGADRIIKSQDPNGSYPHQAPWLAETTFRTLFLVRGRAPLVMNKLEYSLTNKGEAPKMANWNQRPRDVANVVTWLSKQTERHLAWQITNLNGPVEDLLDAPVLYIAGNQSLRFTDDEIAKLRTFVEGGGIILGNADCATDNFSTSFKQLGTKLFPYEFRELPAQHPIYTGQMFPRSKWKTKPAILGMSNGARELMLLLPSADASKAWYLQSSKTQENLFQFAANLYQYTTEQQNFRLRPAPHWVALDPKAKTDSKARIARLEYTGNWNPEPGGWRRLTNWMHNNRATDLDVLTVKLGDGKLDSSFQVAHLTGADNFALTAAARTELKAYLDKGGTLILDAAGGSTAFAESATKELDVILGQDAVKRSVTLPDDHAIYQGDKPRVAYRSFARKSLLGQTNTPRIRGIEINGRTAVFVSSEDLSVGLVGHRIDGITGYDPATATDLMARMIKYAHSRPTATTTTAPAP